MTAPPAAAPRARSGLPFRFELKSADVQARTFSGLASTWEKDFGGDIIEKGAFARTLSHWRGAKASRPIPLLDGHDRFSVLKVLGKLDEAKETNDGLDVDFALVPDDADTEAAMRRLKGGFITGLSIGYTPVKWEYERPTDNANDSPMGFDNRPMGFDNRIRRLKEVKLHEISLVVFPMNDGARADPRSVKDLLAGLRAGELTDEEKQELRALLAAPASTETSSDAPPKGLAPDDPMRLETESRLRAITLRRLATA